MPRELHDHFFNLAKREGFVSRAAYKLIEIDDRKKILRKGNRVLDCGAAPGSWMQVALPRVGVGGCVVGIDLKPITHSFDAQNVATHIGDLSETPPDLLLNLAADATDLNVRLFDVVLCDMAPNTTGDRTIDHHQSVRLCQMLLDQIEYLLHLQGNLVMKVFEGETYPDLMKRMKHMFEKVKGYRPTASRAVSKEMYIIAHGFREDLQWKDDAADAIGKVDLPRNKPSTGWNT